MCVRETFNNCQVMLDLASAGINIDWQDYKGTASGFKMYIKPNRFSLSSALPILKVNECETYRNLYTFSP